jgi:hypothetical protein
MLKKFSDRIQKSSKGWLALSALAGFLLFTALVLPNQSAKADLETGNVGSPDTTFFYSSDDLYNFAEAYGEEGRAAYVRARGTFDVIWPLVYTIFLATGISWLSARAFPPRSRWHLLNLVPVLAMFFDFLENGCTSMVMLRYPQLSPLATGLAPPVSMIKWALVMGSFVLLLVIMGVVIGKRIFKKK